MTGITGICTPFSGCAIGKGFIVLPVNGVQMPVMPARTRDNRLETERGYSQGASAALQAATDAVDEQVLDAWLDRLDRWRAGFRDGFALPRVFKLFKSDDKRERQVALTTLALADGSRRVAE